MLNVTGPPVIAFPPDQILDPDLKTAFSCAESSCSKQDAFDVHKVF